MIFLTNKMEYRYHRKNHSEIYKVIRQLGYGGNGETFLAVETLSGEKVAVKVVMVPTGVNNWKIAMEEVKFLHILGKNPGSCDYIACLRDYWRDADYLFIVTDFIDGLPFSETLRDNLPPTPELLIFMMAWLARGLEFIHLAGLAHRDIKTENIMVDRNTCSPKYIDFGLSCSSDLGDRCRYPTGTPEILPPESVARRTSDLLGAQRQDIFSLGIVFYELANQNRKPYAETRDGYLDYRMYTPPNYPLIPEFRPLVERMINLKAEARPSASQVADELDRWIVSWTGCLEKNGLFTNASQSHIEERKNCKRRGGRYVDPQSAVCRFYRY